MTKKELLWAARIMYDLSDEDIKRLEEKVI